MVISTFSFCHNNFQRLFLRGVKSRYCIIKGNYDKQTSVVTHMLPDTSTQKTTKDSSSPEGPLACVDNAGSNMKVTSSSCGISSSSTSTTVLAEQNSQVHT